MNYLAQVHRQLNIRSQYSVFSKDEPVWHRWMFSHETHLLLQFFKLSANTINDEISLICPAGINRYRRSLSPLAFPNCNIVIASIITFLSHKSNI
jgi:hypothetical protein